MRMLVKGLIGKYDPVIANLCISTCSMSPEKEKNSLMSCTVALRETFVTFTVLTWNTKRFRASTKGDKGEAKTKPDSMQS